MYNVMTMKREALVKDPVYKSLCQATINDSLMVMKFSDIMPTEYHRVDWISISKYELQYSQIDLHNEWVYFSGITEMFYGLEELYKIIHYHQGFQIMDVMDLVSKSTKKILNYLEFDNLAADIDMLCISPDLQLTKQINNMAL